MKFKVPKEILLSAIQKVQNIVSGKATLPILSNILMDVRKSNLKLNATDLDIGISCEIPVEAIEEGAITIPAKRFSDIIKEMPSGAPNINNLPGALPPAYLLLAIPCRSVPVPHFLKIQLER